MGEFVWNPWEQVVDPPLLKGIDEPPCKHCKFWEPIALFKSYGGGGPSREGTRCCHADDMHYDFSCFRSKEVKKP